MPRPSVDVIVPFRGSPADLQELRSRLTGLRVGAGDSVTVVDNTPRGAPPERMPPEGIPVLHAPEQPTPGFARNRGAARGAAEWIVFLDADTEPSSDLLERYFDPSPRERTGLLGGGVLDEVVPAGARAAPRYAYLRSVASQESTLRFGKWGYPKTTNAACRRTAFEAVGGFNEDIRAGEDADLSYRLRAAGWEIERRENAAVVHRNRQTVRAFVAQRAVHGAGAAWLDARYPGSFPARRRPGLLWWGVRAAVGGLLAAVSSRDRDRAIYALLEPLDDCAFELGRSIPNRRPLPDRPPWSWLRLHDEAGS